MSEGALLVTGAGGFIGGRICEAVLQTGFAPLRAGVRRWSSAARIGRFPVDLVRCDVTSPAEVEKALEGVSSVVHCAVGDRTVTVEGTRTLLAAARAAGVRRFVHVSTIDVYGEAGGELSEERPLSYTGRPYGDSKIDAEKACWAEAERGLPVVVLRPSIVHGPFSASWTIEFAQRLQARPWLLAEELCQGTCNLVYVDDLVSAVLLALRRDEAVGEAFNVSGSEQPTWHEYFVALNDALGLAPLEASGAAASRASTLAMAPVRKLAKWAIAHFEDPIMGLYQRSPLAKRIMRGAEGAIRKTPTPAELQLLSRRYSVPTGKAQQRLGYAPRFPMREALPLCAAWLRHHGFVTAGDLRHHGFVTDDASR